MSTSRTNTEGEPQEKLLIQTREGNRSAIIKLEKEIKAAIEVQRVTDSKTVTTEVLAKMNLISTSMEQKLHYIKQ